MNVGVAPFPTSFALDNDPNFSATTNDGKADNIFVDQDTGDIIIIESGFLDSVDGIGPDHEPGVIRREVLSYDDGLGKIQFGAGIFPGPFAAQGSITTTARASLGFHATSA